MRIGEASRRSGLQASAIRYYEAHGIVPSPQRSSAGYREYTRNDLELLRFVRRLRSLELPSTTFVRSSSCTTEAKRPVRRCVLLSPAKRRPSITA